MKFLLGVMQGRLLPKYRGKYQAHPVGEWPKEFSLAAGRELGCIEFILDFEDVDKNPLYKSQGIHDIVKYSEETEVYVRSICADYFMTAPLFADSDTQRKNSLEVLVDLINSATLIGVSDIVIPCVDAAGISGDSRKQAKLIESLQHVQAETENKKVNLALETDLGPNEFAELLTKVDCDYITVNYDVGNSAALGFDFIEEFSAYGNKITNVHIKDRLLHGPSVFLGQGVARISKVVGSLVASSYSGLMIMQAFRDDQGLKIFDEQLKWFRGELAAIHRQLG
jgi:L-ribulose-5-phosphate 3-epimerase